MPGMPGAFPDYAEGFPVGAGPQDSFAEDFPVDFEDDSGEDFGAGFEGDYEDEFAAGYEGDYEIGGGYEGGYETSAQGGWGGDGGAFRGEAQVGGSPIVSGTVDRSGGGNHVYSVGGKVIELP